MRRDYPRLLSSGQHSRVGLLATCCRSHWLKCLTCSRTLRLEHLWSPSYQSQVVFPICNSPCFLWNHSRTLQIHLILRAARSEQATRYWLRWGNEHWKIGQFQDFPWHSELNQGIQQSKDTKEWIYTSLRGPWLCLFWRPLQCSIFQKAISLRHPFLRSFWWNKNQFIQGEQQEPMQQKG
jgi:hypothetical protein